MVGRTRDGARTARVCEDINWHSQIGCVILVLVVTEGTALVFVSAMTIDEDVSTECFFIFFDGKLVARFEARYDVRSRIAHAPRPLGLGDPTWRRKSVVVYRDDVAMVSLVSWGDRLLGRIYDDVCKHTHRSANRKR